jgi:hypothetical protein
MPKRSFSRTSLIRAPDIDLVCILPSFGAAQNVVDLLALDDFGVKVQTLGNDVLVGTRLALEAVLLGVNW